MGSATLQGRLWGARSRDFAARLEQLTLPLGGAVLDAAHVAPGTRLLDAGCGAGLLPIAEDRPVAHPAGRERAVPERVPVGSGGAAVVGFHRAFGARVSNTRHVVDACA